VKIRINVNIKVGRVVKFFVLSDLFLLGGRGFVDPIFSVFIVQKVQGANLATVGIVTALYLILRSTLQIPIANYLDRTPGEKDDFMALIGGLLLAGFCPLALIFVTKVWELYAVQSLLAVAFALYFAAWPTVFSRHLDKDRISFDWSLDSTTTSLAAGITGLLGALIAEAWGFQAVFVAASVLSFVAAFVLMAAPDLILPKPNRNEAIMRGHSPTNLEA
jgi:MFS family permease